MRKGSCLCGSVRFQSVGPWRDVVYCHCSQCRKSSGHYWAATNVPQAALVITSDDGLTWFQSSDFAERGFCANCGSSLFYRRHAEDKIAISAGCLDGPTDLGEIRHIYVKDKGSYYGISDDLPQVEAY